MKEQYVYTISPRLVAAILALLAVAGCSTSDIRVDEVGLAHQSSPNYYNLLLEDPRVRVVDFSLPAGKTDNWHRHPHEAFYVLEAGTIRIHQRDGSYIDATFRKGDVTSHEAWVHKVQNIGTSRFRAIIFEVIDN